ncbi:PRK06770 family protein [Bacillus sp. NPDC094077]|uniref:PRK06770 family protein n=1 Tax=Bacillus sp. NPDC094077 TaxID=3390932 RepID=UPI003D0198C7
MAKKISIWLGSIIGLIALTFGLTFGMLHLSDNSVDEEASAEINEPEKLVVGKQVDGVFINIYVTENSSEEEVIKAMHQMTHQKVVAQQKRGSIPMTKKNAETLKTIISKSNFEKKEELLATAERWANKDFSKIVEEHNFFWDSQEGSVGKATGVMDSVGEQHYILTKFGEEASKELYDSGDLPNIE